MRGAAIDGIASMIISFRCRMLGAQHVPEPSQAIMAGAAPISVADLIGWSMPLTGAVAWFGQHSRWGVEMAMAETMRSTRGNRIPVAATRVA
jgi:hypothetical protein